MKDNKSLVLAVIGVVILILAAIGLTYAYFQHQVENNANIDLITETSTQTDVIFNRDENTLLVNAEPGDSVETTFDIELKASNKTTDSVTYSISWVVEENDFSYEPLNPSDPQLVYSLYSSSDKSTWNLVKSGDCTTLEDTITLASNQTLSAAPNMTAKVYWKMVVEYKSYNYNQATNMAKTLKGHIEVSGLK